MVISLVSPNFIRAGSPVAVIWTISYSIFNRIEGLQSVTSSCFPRIRLYLHSCSLLSWIFWMFYSVQLKLVLKLGRSKTFKRKLPWGLKKMWFKQLQPLAGGRFLSGLAQFLVSKPVGSFRAQVYVSWGKRPTWFLRTICHEESL